MKHRPVVTIMLSSIIVLVVGYGLATQSLRPLGKKTPDAGVAFIVTGDTGTGDDKQKRVALSISKACTDLPCSGVIVAGDLFYPYGVSSTDDAQFTTKFEDMYRHIRKPFYMALGNHDHLGCVSCQIAYATKSAQWNMPSQYYTRDIGLGVLVVLDTDDLTEEQVVWAQKALTGAGSRWKVVVGHHPLVSHDTRHGSARGTLRGRLERILCGAADVYLSGHAHNLEDAGEVCGVRQIISGGGGAEVGEVTGGASPFVSQTNGFVVMGMFETKIAFDFFNQDYAHLYEAAPVRKRDNAKR